MAKYCRIVCLSGLHQPIILKDLEAVILGRSADTKIKEKRCSKTQVELTANYKSFSVQYIHKGSNYGSVTGRITKSGDINTLYHGDIFEFLQGQFPHKIVFDPEPPLLSKQKNGDSKASSNVSTNSNGTKRVIGDEEVSVNKKLCSDANENDNWETFFDGDLYVYNRSASVCKKVASYDMDGTLITTVSGRVFPKDPNDWKIIFAEVPNKLKKLHKDGYKIVIFTNQAGIARGKVSPKDIQSKITRLMRKLGVPAQALVSSGKGKYRKPITGMWDFFIKECNGNQDVDKKLSFYVGDAAGRPEIPKKKKKDHSLSDRLFALNIGLPFYTPEEHFLGQKASEFVMPKFLPNQLPDVPLFEPESTKVPQYPLEILLLVGYPGCGKSTFVKTHLLHRGFVAVNRDALGSWQKCVTLLESALKDGKCVVVDNTNPDRASRQRYVEVAQKHNVPIRCLQFNASLEQSKHNNKFRELTGSDHSKLNEMIYNLYKSKFEEPKLEENFKEIIKVNFVPLFKNEEKEKLYKSFLLEN